MKNQILSGWIGEKIERNIEEFNELFKDKFVRDDFSFLEIVKLAIEKTKLEIMEDLGPNDYSDELDSIAEALKM
ncbi:MAG: hypothetical protein PHN69_07400 [Candidatus Pacebacteria bacterium]|nr:hypothetical protein [Candidatus Paceibacterota bacterium]